MSAFLPLTRTHYGYYPTTITSSVTPPPRVIGVRLGFLCGVLQKLHLTPALEGKVFCYSPSRGFPHGVFVS